MIQLGFEPKSSILLLPLLPLGLWAEEQKTSYTFTFWTSHAKSKLLLIHAFFS